MRMVFIRGLTWRRVCLTAVFFVCLGVSTAMAQDEPAAAEGAEAAPPPAAAAPADPATPATKPKQNLLAWFISAEGLFFYPQLAIGIAILAIIGTNVFGSLRGRFIDDGFVSEFETMVKSKQYKEAFELAKSDSTFLGRVMTAGLSRLSDGYGDAIQMMQETGVSENMKHEHRLSYLSMLANIATMVGLLGTVAGMVASFTVLANSDVSPKPSELAQGVSLALVTTVVGLVEAIPAVMAFTILTNLNNRRVVDVGIVSEQLIRPFKQVTVARKQAAPAAPGAAAPSGSPPAPPATST